MIALGTIRIKLLTGNLFRVVLEPGVSRLGRIRPFIGFDKACGFACRYAVALGYRLRDATGRLSDEECDELVSALATEMGSPS